MEALVTIRIAPSILYRISILERSFIGVEAEAMEIYSQGFHFTITLCHLCVHSSHPNRVAWL